MAITTLDGPADAFEVLQEHFAAPLRVTRPHRVYSIPLDDLRLEAARPASWRYLLIDEETALAAAEISEHGVAIDDGPFVAATNDALVTVQQSIDGDFELRLLKVPAVYLVAIWLHGDENDLLLPLAPAPEGIEANRVYSPAELLSHFTATQ